LVPLPPFPPPSSLLGPFSRLVPASLGFNVDTEDSKGNTLLLVASQNSNRKMVEMLVARGAAINHQNAQGNTALHFAMSFDVEGLIAEYLIQNGADDTIENVDGLTPYDGVK
jgi:ankyrin repeat protein